MPVSGKGREKDESSSPGDRLDSWKEIATYLGRAERTVKRWESDRGLPIHRLPGGGKSSVYAFSAELDEWLQSSRELEAASEQPASVPVASPADMPTETSSVALAAEEGVKSSARPAETVVSAENSLSLPAPASSRFRRSWPSAILFVSLTVLAFILLLRPLHGKWASPSSRSGAPAVSPAEKALAHDLYLKGRYDWNLRTPESLNRALDSFTQAIVHDPGSAEAYVGLADTYDLLREYSTMTESDAYARAIVAAKKAVELDDSLAEAHRALAFAERYGALDFLASQKEFERAIQLNPKDSVAHRWYANAFAVQGWFDLSLAEMKKARELDPTSNATLSDLGILLFNSGRSSEGIALLREVERSSPEFGSAHRYLMRIGFDTHNFPMYLAEGQKAAELSNDPALKDIIESARSGYLHSGPDGMLAAVYAMQKQYSREGKISAVYLAITCVTMGRRQEALQILEDAFARRDQYVVSSMLSDPVLLMMKDEPRYGALLKRIHFPPSPVRAPSIQD